MTYRTTVIGEYLYPLIILKVKRKCKQNYAIRAKKIKPAENGRGFIKLQMGPSFTTFE